MGLGSRIGIVFANIAALIPVFIVLLLSAIMSSEGASKLAKLNGVSEAHKWVTLSTIGLWVLFGGGLVFAFTFGLFLIPWLVTVPYLYGAVLVLLAIVNIVFAGIFFYGANKARLNKAYKDTSSANHKDAKSAFKTLLICGLMMTFGAVFMFGYSIFAIVHYRKGGGITGDVALAGRYGSQIAMAAGQPEFAVPLQQVGGMAEQRLSGNQQQELQQRVGQIGQLNQLSQQYSKSTGKNGGLKSFLSNPQTLETAAKLFESKAPSTI